MSNQYRRKTSKFAIVMIIVGVVMAGGVFWILLSGGGGSKSLVVENRIVKPQKAETGKKITITTIVKNTGEQTGTYTMTPKVNGEKIGTENAELKPGETSKIVMHFSKRESGKYTVSIAGENRKVHIYHIKPIRARKPLERVFWEVEMPDSSRDNAPTYLKLDVDAKTGLKIGFYRHENDNMVLLKESWLTEKEVKEYVNPKLVLGRGTPKSITATVDIRGPSENLLYRRTKRLETGDVKLSGFTLSRAREENYTYRIRPKGKVMENLPVFVERIEVRMDGENVRAVTPQGEYVPVDPFPEALIRSEIEEGYHTIKLSLFNEEGKKVASVENRRVVSR